MASQPNLAIGLRWIFASLGGALVIALISPFAIPAYVILSTWMGRMPQILRLGYLLSEPTEQADAKIYLRPRMHLDTFRPHK